MMDEKLLNKLLYEKNEQDWFDFKRKMEIYQSDGELVKKQRDELLKDILGLANGNSHIVRKTKYLIVGVDNENFEENGMRVLHNVNYKVPSQSEITQWLSGASSPAIVGIECESMKFQEVDLFIITIPPTFDLHETTRELTASGNFQNHVVFMRQDEHTVPASVRDSVAIQQRKYLYRQEISNPPAIWIGIISGAIVALIIGGTKLNTSQAELNTSKWFVQFLFIVLGIFFGGATGYFSKQWNETLHDWPYMTKREKLLISSIVLIVIVATIIFLKL
jgi:hypothetical protein